MNSDEKILYIANMGMVTPIGFNAEMTDASVRANISAYTRSSYENDNRDNITMAAMPDGVFENVWCSDHFEIDEGDRSNQRHDHMTALSLLALEQTLANNDIVEPIPLIMGYSEFDVDNDGLANIFDNLESNFPTQINPTISRAIHSGRAAGIAGLDFIFSYLYDTNYDYFLLGGVDSYHDSDFLAPLIKSDRLLHPQNKNGFVLGEAASFLLLTRHKSLAQVNNGHVIALSPPGLAIEEGAINSDKPYRGDGLASAFSHALQGAAPQSITNLYSTMNGEHYWAKELGVARLRHNEYFNDECITHHPADCFGDLGAASVPILISLAAKNLWRQSNNNSQSLVYGSSDSEKRGAVLMQRLPATE